jgi:TonB family protein
MKQKILRSILCAIFLQVQPSFAQNQSLVADASNSMPIKLIRNRQADFPNLGEYISGKLQYTELAQKNGVEGLVTVEAVIGEEGEVLSVGLLSGIGFGCDEAMMELVSNMPRWTPAIENGQNVLQKVFIRARFQLK